MIPTLDDLHEPPAPSPSARSDSASRFATEDPDARVRLGALSDVVSVLPRRGVEFTVDAIDLITLARFVLGESSGR